MQLIVYTDRCLSCKHKRLFKKLESFATENHATIEERRIHIKKEWKDQAESMGVEIPFVFNGKIALSLKEDLNELI